MGDESRSPAALAADLPDGAARDGATRDGATRDAEFAAFYRETAAGLVGYLMMLGAGAAEAADVVQETMIAARERWATIEHPRAWCHRVAARTWRRGRGRAREVPAGAPGDLPGGRTGLLAVQTPRDPAEAVAERHAIHALLAELPARQREVFAWSVAGFAPAEIAGELGVSPGAVRQSLCRARRTLAERLAETEDR